MKIKDGFVFQSLPGMALVIPPDGEKYYIKLNDTAAFIWQLLQSDVSDAEIVERFAEKFSIDKSKAHESVDKILSEWTDAGFIQ